MDSKKNLVGFNGEQTVDSFNMIPTLLGKVVEFNLLPTRFLQPLLCHRAYRTEPAFMCLTGCFHLRVSPSSCAADTQGKTGAWSQ